MEYNIHTLDNGIRVLHIPSKIPVSYVGVVLDVGTRDELENESGMAHFIEHMLFKGTEKRKSTQIISCLENIGGQIDAYTTKEETYIYSVVPRRYTLKAVDLLSDIVMNSIFPEKELQKERVVVIDEIQSYNDSPSELVYDDFEEMIFPNDAIGRNILGNEASLATFDSAKLKAFTNRCYTANRMVVFALGNLKFDRFVKYVEGCFNLHPSDNKADRKAPSVYTPVQRVVNKDTYQAHCIIGNRCCNITSEDRYTLALLNNILGGPNMSSLLNMAVRERNGLCYTIESGVTSYVDTGVWSIYFGCDEKNLKRTKSICFNQLDKLCNNPISASRLSTAKRQFIGQMLIANQNLENVVLNVSKMVLHNIPLLENKKVIERINQISSEEMLSLSKSLFARENLSVLTYIE